MTTIVSKPPPWLALMLFTETLPRFYRHSTGLQPFQVDGDCLRPWLLPGDRVIVDRNLDPLPGELVVVEMRYRSNPLLLGEGTRWRVEIAIKQLLVTGDDERLVCATGFVRAHGHDIIGPVVAAYRRGWRRRRQYPLRRVRFESFASAADAKRVRPA